jgi:hypothetical protein
MSARRIKIKRRHARELAAAAHSSPIAPSDIFGSSAIDLDEDYLDFPYPELDPAYHHTFDNSQAIMEKYRRARDSAQAAGRPLCASDIEGAVAARQSLDAKGLSHLYSTDFLNTATSTSTSTAAPSITPPAASTPAPGHSTGPRTFDGKAHSSQNAMKHGLTAAAGSALVFLSSKECDAHTSLSVHFTQQFVPMTGAEREIVREIVDALSLARRARDLQTSAMLNDDHRALALYLRYETAHLRAHNAAIKTLLVLQKDRRQRNENHQKWNEPVHWGEYTFVSDDDFPETEPSESPAAAATSASTAGTDSSFRNADFKPWSEMTFSTPNAHQAASEETLEEVKPAA